ncbi:25S rRNA (cytosine-C(5))-methyltransferase rcm1 [Psilocybe cubensis]|uniref:25S rRNA (Cytosine-C(5))-methyltransferase rcm1 n=1 Tax=Psilocybe cubensis TaxID=181762 RepID=A0ACB8H1S2_PSICU|nr:25S rRNA (cytosine-C(5))-methyltransferase rcm1 [Psilocybe cubensis]KAH9481642.1 25S rRNA (cytosine-C(5))-methyltransferase rcm1 [Psilocybe cubensis]
MNFYFEAAKTLDRIDAKEGSIKGIIATLPEKDRKRTAALVIETLKFKAVLLEVIEKAKLMKEERKLTSKNLALILVHDLLLARGIQAGDGPLKQAVLRHKTRLHGEFQKIKIKRGATSNEQLAHNGDERAGLGTLEEAIQSLKSRGFELSDPFSSKKGFSKDAHVPNLLLFHPSTTFQTDPLYTSGKIILQDKASCFPALVLSPPATEESVVIDATAAPGNKTSHLSALMKNRGKLFAFERDRKRFTTLKMMLSKAGCSNALPINADFLTTDPQDPQFSNVTHIGSGIVNRLDHLIETEIENDADKEERLDKLAAFQLMMIKHAMRFPNVKKIVYSTCSIHATENERVVCNALESEEAVAGSFQLAPQTEVLPTWPRRGYPEEMTSSPDQASSLVRCLPGEDATNGFFVSCFIKVQDTTSKRKLDADDDVEEVLTQKAHKKKKKRRKTANKSE